MKTTFGILHFSLSMLLGIFSHAFGIKGTFCIVFAVTIFFSQWIEGYTVYTTVIGAGDSRSRFLVCQSRERSHLFLRRLPDFCTTVLIMNSILFIKRKIIFKKLFMYSWHFKGFVMTRASFSRPFTPTKPTYISVKEFS